MTLSCNLFSLIYLVTLIVPTLSSPVAETVYRLLVAAILYPVSYAVVPTAQGVVPPVTVPVDGSVGKSAKYVGAKDAHRLIPVLEIEVGVLVRAERTAGAFPLFADSYSYICLLYTSPSPRD